MNCTKTQLPQCTQQPPELAGTAQQSWHLRFVGRFLVEPIWGSLMPAWPASCKADRVFPLKTSQSAPSLKMLSLYHPGSEVKVFVLGEGYSRQSKIAKPQNCHKTHLEDGSKPPKRFKTRDVRQPKQKPLRSAFKNPPIDLQNHPNQTFTSASSQQTKKTAAVLQCKNIHKQKTRCTKMHQAPVISEVFYPSLRVAKAPQAPSIQKM